MNLSDYLITHREKSAYDIYGSYTEIHLEYMVIPHYIIINTDLDIHGSGVIYSYQISGIISVRKSLWVKFNSILPGSFINSRIFDKSVAGTYINRLLINGYVMNNGVLS